MRLLTTLLIFGCLIAGNASAGVPASVRADLIKDEIIADLQANRLQSARRNIIKYRALKVGLPAALEIIDAKLAAATKQYIESKNILENYFNQYQKSHSSYAEALSLYKKILQPAALEEARIKAAKNKANMIQREKNKLEAERIRTREKFQQLKTECETGWSSHANSCYRLAVKYEHAQGVKQNFNLAAKYYKDSCSPINQIIVGCTALGEMYENFKVKVKYPKSEAFLLYQSVCKNAKDQSKIQRSCANLGRLYREDITQDNYVWSASSSRLARKYYRLSCQAGSSSSCETSNKIPKDTDEIYFEFEQACDQGIGKSCYQVAEWQMEGRKFARNHFEARDNFKKGCNLNHSESCLRLGLIYLKGEGTASVNLMLAKKWLSKACQQGVHPIACQKLNELASTFKTKLNELDKQKES